MEKAPSTDHSGVVARPPLVQLAAILVGVALQRLLPIPLRVPAAGILGPVLAIGAMSLFAIAVRTMLTAGTGIQTSEPSTMIVRSGPFRFTRNPIYLAFGVLHLAAAVWSGNGWMLLTLVAAFVVMNVGVVAREEAYLERKFGEEYTSYKKRVRRWL